MSENEIEVIDEKQIAVQINQDAPPMVQIAQMMQAGVKIDVDQMAKFQEMSERFEANQARIDFAADFTVVQSNIAAVVKTKDNKQTHSKYAGLDDVINMAKPVYTEQGFSVIFYEGETDVPENIRVCADVLHKSGHEKTYHFDVPLDGVGIKGNANMTKIHGKASSVSYGKRYLMCMIWNIPTQDDDGNQPVNTAAPTMPTLNEQEAAVIVEICNAMPARPGFAPNREAITRFSYVANGNNHVRKIERLESCVEYFLKTYKDSDLYMEVK